MHQIFHTRDLQNRLGIDSHELKRLVRAGELVKLRRGAYSESAEASPAALHLQVVAATVGLISEDAVVSHRSAAVLHGLPLPYSSRDEQVTTTRPRESGRTATNHHGYTCDLPEGDCTEVSGIRCTSVARTCADLARSGPLAWAVAATDYALHNGLVTADELRSVLGPLRGRVGVRAARRAVELSDPLSGSVGESISRVEFVRAGLPRPELQTAWHDDEGLIGYTDFYWRHADVIGEFDGRMKYEPGRSDRDAFEVVWREKVREDRLRARVAGIVRWSWADIVPSSARLIMRLRTRLLRS